MADKKLNRYIALTVFILSGFVYYLTLSGTVVFWDVGEFIAASVLLQVPHPPGSPLFILLGRIASILPYYADVAARVHAMSALSSALSVMFLYLVGVKVVTRLRGVPSSLFDRIVIYGASAIGALTLAYSGTFWFNATEAEVYGLSMIFVAVIMWLAFQWWDMSEEPHNEKYMLLIAYLIGLSVGVHLLAVLTIFPVLMIIYFRRYEVNRNSFIKFSIIALVVFFVIYPGVVQLMPSMLDGEFKGFKSDLLPFLPPLLIVAAGYGIYRAKQTNHKLLQVACLSFLFIVLGYTTYTIVIMRANVDNIPMNENSPHDMAGLVSYLGREQYGDTPLLKGESWSNEQQTFVTKYFPRRYSPEAMHKPTRENYTSDTDFLWRYQINHMFIRYILWNFIGAEGDWQDAGVSWKPTWGIPFLLALFGIYYHFKKDWKFGLVFMAMFLIMGVVLALYQNQQDPQPRERDYFYVGAYYVMALWVAVGLVGLIDLVRAKLKDERMSRATSLGILCIALIAVPGNLLRINWHERDRSGNYIAWDYSYNILQSCEPNGILFTNGDNDTFPLWYLQDVEGVRRDVRIVNLSLVNTSWYIRQMKNDSPHGALKVPISLSDAAIDRIQPQAWKPKQMDIPVSKDIYNKFVATDRPEQPTVSLVDSTVLAQGKISFMLNGVPFREDVNVLRVQDIMVHNIIMANRWDRPIHFAVTCSPDSKIGLENYLWMQGLTYKLRPFKINENQMGMDYNIMADHLFAENVQPSKTPQKGYIFRNLNNKKVYYDENVQRMVMNYRFNFIRLAEYANRAQNDRAKAKSILARMENIMPLEVNPMSDTKLMSYIMNFFVQVGDSVNFEKYAGTLEGMAKKLLDENKVETEDPFFAYRTLVEIYDSRKDYSSALDILRRAAAQYPNVPDLTNRIQYYEKMLQNPSAPDTNKLP
jgi:hypothetical protein